MVEMKGLTLQLADQYNNSSPEVQKWMLENIDEWFNEEELNDIIKFEND